MASWRSSSLRAVTIAIPIKRGLKGWMLGEPPEKTLVTIAIPIKRGLKVFLSNGEQIPDGVTIAIPIKRGLKATMKYAIIPPLDSYNCYPD